MLPLHIADATAAIRASGRRISTRCSSCLHSLHSCAPATASNPNHHLPQQQPPPQPPLWSPTRRSTMANDLQWPLINRIFVGALMRASLCRVHSAFYSTVAQPARPPHPPPPPSQRASERLLVRYEVRAYLKSLEEMFWYGRKVPDEYKPALRSIPEIGRGGSVLPPPPERAVRDWHSRPIFDSEAYIRSLMPMAFPEDWDAVQNLRTFRKVARQAHKSPSSVSDETLFELYRKLPGNRAPFLDRKTFEILIGRLMSVPQRNQVSLLRYLTLIEDMKAAGIPITRPEWNQAVAFVIRSFKYTTSTELHAALELWKQSERACGLLADITTFNILLYGASETKSVPLASTIMKEIRERKLRYDRFTYTTLMMYHANLNDGVMVQKTYQELVDAGEVVDTTVLNAFMTALLKVGEERSAANIYAYMRSMATMPDQQPPRKLSWKQTRLIARKLKDRGLVQWGQLYVNDLCVQLGPDFRTFHLWIHVYCRSGDWERVQYYLHDMESFGHPVARDVYLSLLKGFTWHGKPFSEAAWNPEKLRFVLEKVLGRAGGAVGRWDRVMAVWVVRAVEKVFQSEELLARVWEEIVTQWTAEGGIISNFAYSVHLAAMRSIAFANENKKGTESPEPQPQQPPPSSPTAVKNRLEAI